MCGSVVTRWQRSGLWVVDGKKWAVELIVKDHGPRRNPNSVEGWANGFVSDFVCNCCEKLFETKVRKTIFVHTIADILLPPFVMII
jgi:hypothetical protein